MRIDRKLEDIRQDLALLGEQGKTKGFFNNVENADKLGGLVEDVRDALMDYQVCASNNISFSYLNFLQTSLQQDTYNKSCLLIVSPVSSSFLPHLVADKQTGIGGPRPSGQDVPHPGCRVLVWGQEGLPEGNSKGYPMGD